MFIFNYYFQIFFGVIFQLSAILQFVNDRLNKHKSLQSVVIGLFEFG